jgi:signal peptide peptidase SppA
MLNHDVLHRFDQKPALIAPDHANRIKTAATITTDDLKAMQDPMELCAQAYGFQTRDDKPFVFNDGIAIIPVYGALLHRYGYVSSYATGYDFIRAQFQLAMHDPEVKGIVFDINSYGGQVSGNFELCDEIYEGRKTKPSIAIVDGSAYSGGYSIASSAGRVAVSPSSGVGSIGVVMMHVSFEKMLADDGVEVTFIYAGKHKVDGNMYKDLSADALKRFQAGVDKSYEKFVALVARNRAIEVDAVKATEALCYDADEALPLDLIDAIQTPQDALAAFRNGLKSSVSPLNRGARKMSNENENGGEQTVTQSEHNAAVAAAASTATATAAKAERERIDAITNCEEAKGKGKLALSIATKTSLSLDEAKAMLAAAAPEVTATAAVTNHLAAAMDALGSPNIEAGGEGGEGTPDPSARAKRIAGNYAAVTGKKPLTVVK